MHNSDAGIRKLQAEIAQLQALLKKKKAELAALVDEPATAKTKTVRRQLFFRSGTI